ncbi:Avr9 Cf-9 rapidly elicited protein 146 [Musa troglodytarum]|uniref:Avr9 Cf-9 rapidly elicited protein 146 n=1 Tax=Musa troglodytarum TaxID=320322 RepID=A0A9E7L788_9LILI|nr:Avr9 Cf-9 rapidly elicited protein 146 [Musa troglodytarum]
MEPSLAKRLRHMITAAYYMLRKGFTKHRLMMDLHLLLKRGKLAGKAVGNFVAFHHHRDRRIGANMYSAFSSRHVDTDLSYYDPKEIEMLNSEVFDAESSSVVASPSPAPMWGFGKSPAAVRQLRITDSPFPTRDEDAEADGRVDQEAEEFIRRFYEQLRLQRSVPTTPECHCHRRRSPA